MTLTDFLAAFNSKQGDPRYRAELDINGDGWVTIGDLARFLMGQRTVWTALIQSVDGTPHEARIPGVGPGWDFYDHGVIQSQPSGRKASGGWASFQEQIGNRGGLAIETRNWQHWAFNGTWHKQTTDVYGSQVHPQPPHEGGIIGSMGTGPAFALPRHGVGSQWFSPQRGLPPDTIGVITVFQVRLVGTGDLLVTAGADYFPFEGSPGGNGGACVGRYIKPTGSWRWVAGSSLDVATLRRNPPPL